MHGTTSAKRHVVVNSAAGITQHLLAALRDVVLAAVTSRPAADGGTASIQFRACAMLYLLLNDHPLDRRGRCRSCSRPGAMLGQRHRKCRIHAKARLWLRQPDDVVLHHLASELNHHPALVRGTGLPNRCHLTQAFATHDRDATEVLPRIPVEPCTQPAVAQNRIRSRLSC